MNISNNTNRVAAPQTNAAKPASNPAPQAQAQVQRRPLASPDINDVSPQPGSVVTAKSDRIAPEQLEGIIDSLRSVETGGSLVNQTKAAIKERGLAGGIKKETIMNALESVDQRARAAATEAPVERPNDIHSAFADAMNDLNARARETGASGRTLEAARQALVERYRAAYSPE